MKLISIARSKEYPITGIALLVDNKNVSKCAWLDAVYANLIEAGIINEETRREDLANLIEWPVDSDKSKLLSLNWNLNYEVNADSQNRPNLNKIDSITESEAPAKDLSSAEIVEIITKLEAICPKYFKNNIA